MNFAYENRLQVPAWAKAENMEVSEALENLWDLDEDAQKQGKEYSLRKGFAMWLYHLADRLYNVRGEYRIVVTVQNQV